MSAPLLVSATIGRTHGLEGHVRVYSLSGEYDHLRKLSSCLVKLPDGEELVLTVDDTKVKGDVFLMKFREYPTPEKARFLSRSEILIKREEAPPLGEGEYYTADLYGMDVMHSGRKLGVVKSTAEGGQALLLVIVRDDNGKEYLVPLLPYFINNVSVENNSLELLNPALLDIE